jgi:hypothetical protein
MADLGRVEASGAFFEKNEPKKRSRLQSRDFAKAGNPRTEKFFGSFFQKRTSSLRLKPLPR